MAQKRKTCLTCSTYDQERNLCRVGKANPRKKHESQTVAELMGVQTLCIHNPFREPLILRMRFHKRRFIWDETPASARRQPIEVEIIEDNEETDYVKPEAKPDRRHRDQQRDHPRRAG